MPISMAVSDHYLALCNRQYPATLCEILNPANGDLIRKLDVQIQPKVEAQIYIANDHIILLFYFNVYWCQTILIWNILDGFSVNEYDFDFFNSIDCFPCNLPTYLYLSNFPMISYISLRNVDPLMNEYNEESVIRIDSEYSCEYNLKRNIIIGYKHENDVQCFNMDKITTQRSVCQNVTHHRKCHAPLDHRHRTLWCNDDFVVKLYENKMYIFRIFHDHVDFLYEILATDIESLLYVDNRKIIGYSKREILVVDFTRKETKKTPPSIGKLTCKCLIS